MRSSLLLVFVFLLFCSLISSSLSEKCNPSDKIALLRLKKDFGNPYVLASWDPKTDCCEWYCVKCDEKTNRITQIFVNVGSLPGPIPASIGNLPLLESLSLHKQPEMTGPIPPAIAKLTNLNFLDISYTNISGSVPDFLSTLTKLTYINLSFNNLTGSIPSSLSKLQNLQYLDFGRNKLTGSIPETFGEFKITDFTLFLSHNQLSGRIPTSLGKINFFRFDLSRNKLEGDASFFFGANRKTNLWQVDLSGNLLAFNLSNLGLPESMRYLDLSHNKITGGIPQSWTTLENLSRFNVSYNMLCGQIPVGGVLQTLDYTSYFHNKCLCGSPLPSCKTFRTDSYLTFQKQPEFTGPIQPAIAKLKNLNFLSISWTKVSGQISDFLSEMKKLTFTNLSFSNRYIGSIYPEFTFKTAKPSRLGFDQKQT
ncbi:hypothetical protein ACFE04_001234 [Oxalis oulophora]